MVYPVVVQALLVMLATALVCITRQSRGRRWKSTALVALLGFVIYSLVQAGGLWDRLSPAVTAVFIGFAARLVALKMGSPQLVVAVPALLFLLPGFAISRAMYILTVHPDDPTTGLFGLFSALTVILAMAGGAVLGRQPCPPAHPRLGFQRRPAQPAPLTFQPLRAGREGPAVAAKPTLRERPNGGRGSRRG